MVTTVFTNVAIFLLYMFLGFLLAKGKKAFAAHAKSMSGLLIYVLGPAMIINSFLQIERTEENIIAMLKYFGVSFAIQAVFIGLLYIMLHKKYTDARYRIMSVGGVLGNVGFFGMPVVSGIFPDQPIVMVYSSINVMSMNLIVFTLGVFLITNDRKYISFKNAILNPTTLGIFAAIALFGFQVELPETLGNSVALLAKMVTPMCMIILGIRLSTETFRDVFGKAFVYVTCALKLIVFPLFAFLCVKWLPFLDNVAKTAVFVLAATPAGAIIESLSELHECEQELSANVVLLTTLCTILTMPAVLYFCMNVVGV